MHASESGWAVVTARAAESARRVPLRPIVEALTNIARSGEAAVPAAAAELGKHRSALTLIVPWWDQAADQDVEVTQVIAYDAVIRLLSCMGADTGTLLVLENPHLADPEILALVEYLADHLADQKALWIAMLRRAEPPRAAALIRELYARRVITLIEICRLSGEHMEQMARASLARQGIAADVLTPILGSCDGLPFAAEEVLATVVSSGGLVLDEAGFP